MKLPKGTVEFAAGCVINSAFGRTNRHRKTIIKSANDYHVVLSHPDDELTILKLLKIFVEKGDSPSYTLLTNGTQGYETDELYSRNEYGDLRVEELRGSLGAIGVRSIQNIEALLDERKIYEDITNHKYDSVVSRLLHAHEEIKRKLFTGSKNIVFVNDFAGGHIIHDMANMITTSAAKVAGNTRVVEYWQPFLHVKKKVSFDQLKKAMSMLAETGKESSEIEIVLGSLGYDTWGRYVRGDGTKHQYSFCDAHLGIKNGRLFQSVSDLTDAIQHKKDHYKTQEKSLGRTLQLTRFSARATACPFREINLDTIDYAKRPTQGVLYEVTGWRTRGLSRLPQFYDFAQIASRFIRSV